MNAKEDSVWKDTFFNEDFNVDLCLSKYTQKSDLETLKANLKNYGLMLHQQMADILKTETEAIVNLAEYLTNLNSRIEDLCIPVSQLREEIKSLHDLIGKTEADYKCTLELIEEKSIKKKHLILKSDLFSTTLYVDNMIKARTNNVNEDMTLLERAVMKYSFQMSYLTELGIMPDSDKTIFDTEKKLTDMVNQKFLSAVKSKNGDLLTRCLRMYNNLNKHSVAETFYQIQVVRPSIQRIFTESNLEKCNQDVNQLFLQTLEFLNVDMLLLNDILNRNMDLKPFFSFVLNSFWKEVDKQCREGLPHITAPGNPELFQKRFKSTWNLLIKISEKYGDPSLIKTNRTFQEHIKRFNLAVYFEIRFQQIAGKFETDLVVKPGDAALILDGLAGYQLSITEGLHKALKRCLSPDVFIDHLTDHFLKLSMLLLSRYFSWFEKALLENDTFHLSADKWEEFVMKSLVDLHKVKQIAGSSACSEEMFNESIYGIIPTKMQPLLLKIVKLNDNMINNFCVKLTDHLVSIKVKEISGYLQNVGAIPRLFRRTNRNAPKESSTYMVQAMKPVTDFHRSYSTIIDSILVPVLDGIILTITNRYLTLVQDVLRSVCKTEESLRRLKNRNFTPNEEQNTAISPETMTDEMKIREQIKLDVKYFVDTLNVLASHTSQKAMEDLQEQICF